MLPKNLFTLIILLITSLFLIGCAAAPEVTSTAPTVQATATLTSLKVAGTIRLGLSTSETGKHTRQGTGVKQGFELWGDNFNLSSRVKSQLYNLMQYSILCNKWLPT